MSSSITGCVYGIIALLYGIFLFTKVYRSALYIRTNHVDCPKKFKLLWTPYNIKMKTLNLYMSFIYLIRKLVFCGIILVFYDNPTFSIELLIGCTVVFYIILIYLRPLCSKLN